MLLDNKSNFWGADQLLTFAFLVNKASPKQSKLTIYDQQHCYHSDVIPMFKPFYLKL
ncbi:hypothetical protein [Gallibacterium genomosp. 2]|uniref:hypothetical protein n=1 Tax=Gallibacterium genomosp. 2 TaxID=155517 RepID=UPI000A805F5E|nr:hypothetical protein [Gallibacterium genomosp. 2]